MLLLFERLGVGWLIFLVDAALTPVPINICKLINSESVFLVKGGSVEMLNSGHGLFRCLVLDESESSGQKNEYQMSSSKEIVKFRAIPFRHPLVVQRHEN